MPSGVLFDVIEGRLTDTDLRVAAALGTMSENHWIKDTRQARIAERCGLRRETVSRAIKRLQEAGWLEVVDPGRPSGILTYLLLYDRRPLQEGPDAQEGEAQSQAQSETSQGGVRLDAQGEGVCVETHRGGVRQLDHTPCDPSAHTYTNPSSKEYSPLPPLPGETRPAACTGPDGPDASADGGTKREGATALPGGKGDPARPGARIDGADAPENGQTLSLSAQAMAGVRPPAGVDPDTSSNAASFEKKAHSRGDGVKARACPETTPGPDALEPLAFRERVRAAVGPERYRAHFARLRVVNGWLVSPGWGHATALWRDFADLLREAGVSVIWADHDKREVRP